MNLGSVSSTTQTKSPWIINPEVAESVGLSFLHQGPPSPAPCHLHRRSAGVLCAPSSQPLCHSCCLSVLCLIHTAHLNSFLVRFLIWFLVPPSERESTIILSNTAPVSRRIDAIHLKVCFLAALFPVTWVVPYIPRWSVIQTLLLKLFLFFFFFLSSSLFVELFWYRSAIVSSGCPLFACDGPVALVGR